MSRKSAAFDLDRALQEVPCSYPMIQWRTELEEFCQFLADQGVRSFLEVGCAWGQLSVFLKDALGLEAAYACDLFRSPLLARRPDIPFHYGDHQGEEYLAWREQIGPIDMVFIDADHETGFRADWQIERRFPHRFIAFHDIANPGYPELCDFWESEVPGRKQSFVNRDPHIPFGVPPLSYPFLTWDSAEDYEKLFGRSCGIGVYWNESP